MSLGFYNNMEYEMITEKDIIRQQIILKHSREIVKLKRNIEKRNVIIRKLEKERWINYSNDICGCPF